MKKRFVVRVLVGVMLFSFAVAATPSASAIDAPPSLMLLGAGARWAAGEGGERRCM